MGPHLDYTSTIDGKAVTTGMNGIEKITARIEKDAGDEIAGILREAEEKAKAIRGEYEAQAKAEAAEAAESCKKAAVERLERLEGAAEMEAKKLTLAAKQESIESAFAAAQKKLCSLPEAEYVELLAKLAVRSAKTGREEVIMSKKDREAVGAKVVARANALLAKAAAPEMPSELKDSKAGGILTKVVTGASALLQGTAMLTLSQETREMDGGLTLKDGKVEINCAFETQLRMLRETMAAEVAKTLFD